MSDLIQNLTMADYLANSAYGSSDLIKMARSFAYWKYRKSHPEKPTRALTVGSVTHLLLEAEVSNKKELVANGVLLFTEGSWRTKAFDEVSKKHPNLYCIDQDEYRLCQKMVKALLDESEVMGYLKDAITEPTIIANYPGTNIKCKIRPDYLHRGRGVSINLKTTTDASESGFIYGAKDWLYDFQSAFYIDMLSETMGKPFDEVHILVEKTDDDEPCPIKIFSFGDETISWARSQIRTLLDALPACEKTGVWPKSNVKLETIDLPIYARKIVQL